MTKKPSRRQFLAAGAAAATWATARTYAAGAKASPAETVNMAHTRKHYYGSHETINPHRIVSTGPVLDYAEPHGRDRLSVAA